MSTQRIEEKSIAHNSQCRTGMVHSMECTACFIKRGKRYRTLILCLPPSVHPAHYKPTNLLPSHTPSPHRQSPSTERVIKAYGSPFHVLSHPIRIPITPRPHPSLAPSLRSFPKRLESKDGRHVYEYPSFVLGKRGCVVAVVNAGVDKLLYIRCMYICLYIV